MAICCRPNCGNTTPEKGEPYYKQHCVPKWTHNNIKDNDSSMERGEQLIDYFTNKTLQNPLVHGKWCASCEQKFTINDTNGLRLLGRQKDGSPQGILKNTRKVRTKMKYKQFNKGKPINTLTSEGIKSGRSFLLIEHHREPSPKARCSSLDEQIKLKKFLLSVLERLQYHPDASRFPLFAHFNEMGISLGTESNFDIVVSEYFNEDPLWENIKFCMNDPVISKANSLNSTEVKILGIPESVKAEWSLCGFKVSVFPRLENRDHLWLRHPSWFLGRTKDFKIGLQLFDNSPMANSIADHHNSKEPKDD